MGKQRDLRVGDRERELAMELLGRHMSAGRLEVDEYDQRCVRAASARYASELDAPSTTLPSPRPSDHAPVPVRPAPASRTGNVVLVACVGAMLVFLAIVVKQPAFVVLLVLAFGLWFARGRR
uniref:ORF122 protein n=1 Tax=Saccharopolyspora erythraea TaxID=1836 RepID=Q54106_SACER|nr:ORF122 [Saccharopolyspora erythraea NRRL 2338]